MNDLAIHIARYGELIEILDWAEGRRMALASEEGKGEEVTE